ncbi:MULTISPECIES: hypothetical protein [unclassified Streptomyces]|uniref:hypothetical protein n=1 Tax=unclassified Streptomyces TaxID=2593676 RepID=UPI003D8A5CE2
MQERRWITVRRSERDALAEELAKQLQEVQVERGELAIAERVLNRLDREILAIVREADGPVQVRAVGERLGLDASVRGKLEPLRAKMVKLADRGWLHKRGDGRFTPRS